MSLYPISGSVKETGVNRGGGGKVERREEGERKRGEASQESHLDRVLKLSRHLQGRGAQGVLSRRGMEAHHEGCG